MNNINMSNHGSDQDVNEGTPLDGAVMAQTGHGIEQQNTAATGSAVETAGMDDSQVEDTITHYEAWRYTLHTDYLRLAKKVKVRTKKPKHPVLGEAQLECFTKSALTNTEKAELIVNGSKDMIKAILPVVDDMERALTAMSDDEGAKEGVQLIYNKMMNILSQKGLKPMEAKGVKFDENLHEAVTQFPAADEGQKGTVVDVVEKGYFLNDKVLRYAKVVVAI